MKILITFSILIITLIAFGQVASLDILNPVPRVGEEIKISASMNNGDMKVDFTRTALDTGNITFGPFQFTVDGENYNTDSLKIKVYPELPRNKKNGIWIRQVHFKGKHLLIIEQRIPNNLKIPSEWSKAENKEEISWTSYNNEPQYAEIDEERISYKGLKINFTYSSYANQVVDSSRINKDGVVNYKMSIYEIKVTKDYDGKFVLNDNYFKYFPKDTDFEEIKIQ